MTVSMNGVDASQFILKKFPFVVFIARGGEFLSRGYTATLWLHDEHGFEASWVPRRETIEFRNPNAIWDRAGAADGGHKFFFKEAKHAVEFKLRFG